MIFHQVLYKGKGLQSRGLFKTFRRGKRFQIIDITRCESLRNEQDFIKFTCQPKISSMFAISYRANALAQRYCSIIECLPYQRDLLMVLTKQDVIRKNLKI